MCVGSNAASSPGLHAVQFLDASGSRYAHSAVMPKAELQWSMRSYRSYIRAEMRDMQFAALALRMGIILHRAQDQVLIRAWTHSRLIVVAAPPIDSHIRMISGTHCSGNAGVVLDAPYGHS